MPRSLHEVKVGREHFDRIAKQAMGTPWVPRNPRPIPGSAQVREGDAFLQHGSILLQDEQQMVARVTRAISAI